MVDLQSSGNNNNQNIINYVVKKGDTLSKIAKLYGTTVNEIAGINKIKNVNLIYPGQVLEIILKSNNIEHTQNTITYIIKRGDNLWNIARKYGVSVNDIVKWNNIKNKNLIYAGNRLIIYTNNQTNYIVKRGDTLSAIALKYNTTVNRLVQINGIKNKNLIYVGQIIKIY